MSLREAGLTALFSFLASAAKKSSKEWFKVCVCGGVGWG